MQRKLRARGRAVNNTRFWKTVQTTARAFMFYSGHGAPPENLISRGRCARVFARNPIARRVSSAGSADSVAATPENRRRRDSYAVFPRPVVPCPSDGYFLLTLHIENQRETRLARSLETKILDALGRNNISRLFVSPFFSNYM